MALTDLSQGLSGGSGIGINDLITAEKVFYKSITLTDIINKYITVSASIGSGGKLKIYTVEGIVLRFGVDYTVNTGLLRIDWSGLGLDGLIAAGDVLQIVYLSDA